MPFVDSFTDGAIRANGQSAEGREMRALVAWDDGSDGTGMYLEDADSSVGTFGLGWFVSCVSLGFCFSFACCCCFG